MENSWSTNHIETTMNKVTKKDVMDAIEYFWQTF